MKKSIVMEKKKLPSMNMVMMLVLIVAMLAVVASGCSSDTKSGESQDTGNLTASQGEHQRDSGESGEGEESGNQLTLNETYDVVRKGARLIMNYDKESNSFKGMVENTTGNTLAKVRVEVHLSNGTELGPTTPVDLAPGEKIDVTLPGTSKAFDGWTPHAEVGGNEHGAEGSSEGSEGNESSGEHGSGGD